MSSEQPKKKLTEGRRSSLKTYDNNPQNLLKIKDKRHSVSWGKSDTFQFKQMKATFQETKEVEIPEKEKEEKHKEFVENRRKSIKDEFSLVKEALKKHIIEEEDDDETNETNDEVKKNTDQNIKLGHEAALMEVDSDSNNSENSENSEEK